MARKPKKMTPKGIVVHCSATLNGADCLAEEIDKWHKKRGWIKCGYHMVIQPDGRVQNAGNSPCREINEQGAHVPEVNKDHVAICLAGTDRFSRSQFDSLLRECDALRMLYSIPLWTIRCHYEFKSAQEQGKTCPNISLNHLMGWIMQEDLRAIQPHLLGGC